MITHPIGVNIVISVYQMTLYDKNFHNKSPITATWICVQCLVKYTGTQAIMEYTFTEKC